GMVECSRPKRGEGGCVLAVDGDGGDTEGHGRLSCRLWSPVIVI
ncbi:MAG: hypothetical protein ACJAXA_000378, partial [Candidatus Aldehydirespiratoraceae bacterium]